MKTTATEEIDELDVEVCALALGARSPAEGKDNNSNLITRS